MQKIVGIRFKPAGKIYYFDPQQIYLHVGDKAIVETARGLEYGSVASKVRYVEEETLKHPIKTVVRKATAKDDKTHEKNLEKAVEAIEICNREIAKYKLEMKIIRAEYTFDATKVIFYFTADGRIDFRDLVKDLASIFRIRIELRQIGVRDEAKMMGGIGCCGRELCCNKWLSEFEPVSIKMAKEQGLSLNPGKISGICGRLLCCLQYEHLCYEENLRTLPNIGQIVKTSDGEGVVQKLNVLKKSVLVRMNDDQNIVKEFPEKEIKVIGGKKKHKVHKMQNEEEMLQEDELKELNALKEEKFTKSDKR